VARTVRWTETALQDLEEAAAFIGRDSRFYAAALVQETRAAARSLRTFAECGWVVPEIEAPDIRELFIGRFEVTDAILTGATQIAHGVVLDLGDVDGGEVARPYQPGQLAGIAAVGFGLVSGFSRNQ
jgi:toxin ParE1/3/4